MYILATLDHRASRVHATLSASRRIAIRPTGAKAHRPEAPGLSLMVTDLDRCSWVLIVLTLRGFHVAMTPRHGPSRSFARSL